MFHTQKGKQKRIMGWYKGETNPSPRETEHCYVFPHFCLRCPPASWPCHMDSVSNIPLDGGASIPRCTSPVASPGLTWAPFSSSTLAQATWPPRQASWRADTRSVVTRFTLKPCKAGPGCEGKALPGPQLLQAGEGAHGRESPVQGVCAGKGLSLGWCCAVIQFFSHKPQLVMGLKRKQLQAMPSF